MKNEPGVYRITNTTNGKVYVGSSKYIKWRVESHFWELARHRHINRHLQGAFDRDGRDSFIADVLEYTSEEKRFRREIVWIKHLDSTDPDKGYNLVIPTDLGGFSKLADDVRERISKAHLGKTKSEETRRRMSEATKGRKKTDEHKRKLSESIRRHIQENSRTTTYVHSEETKQKMRDAWKRRKGQTE